MGDSESSNPNVKYQDKYGENLLADVKKPLSTDTDYYFNMIANPEKVYEEKKDVEESSEINLSEVTDKKTETKPNFDKVNITSPVRPREQQSVRFMDVNNGGTENRHTNRKTEEQAYAPEQQRLSPFEIKKRKRELLIKLSQLKEKGIAPSRDYSQNDLLEDIEYEYESLKAYVDKKNGVKVFKNLIVQGTSLIEFFNDKYDPFEFHLSGWSDHVAVESDNWEDVIGELYEKYGGAGRSLPPELKLLGLLGMSAGAFHLSKSGSSKLPGLDAVLASNPNLLSKVMNTQQQKSRYVTPQELNIERHEEELRTKQQHIQQMQMAQLREQQLKIEELERRLSISRELDSKVEAKPAINIQAPTQVKDILSRIHNINNNTSQTSKLRSTEAETQEESANNDRLVSESAYTDSAGSKKRGRKSKIFVET